MSVFKSYWTVQDISPEARNSAVRAADAEGEELGVWLSRLIYKVSLAEREAVPVVDDSAEDAVERTLEDAADETVADPVKDPVEDAVKDADDKMSSIERAMQQSRAAGDAGSG